jgi:acetyl/propionyl-CoA carboxylase alpha subunit
MNFSLFHSDKESLYVSEGDEGIRIGDGDVKESYLNMSKLIKAAVDSGADAVHPGYGFLSESGDFARACVDAGLVWVGPSGACMDTMGSKIEAKRLLCDRVKDVVEVVPGYSGDAQDVDTLVREANKIGYPVLIKASAGGGGRGMRVVRNAGEVEGQLAMAKSEALNAFGDDRVLLERYFEAVRHIEVQVLGDAHGDAIHLFERECSVQRRHQKVVEECPSATISEALRARMLHASVSIAKAVGYVNAGTIEFIVPNCRQADAAPAAASSAAADDDHLDERFYFLEMNTRLQVEHPVTEMVSGVDLVALQIGVAEGARLCDLVDSRALLARGHAIECRLYAEDPSNNFFPSTGKIVCWQPDPAALDSASVRFETSIRSGNTISIHYDPMISKIVVHAPSRDDAIETMIVTLQRTVICGVRTNRRFLLDILTHDIFRRPANRLSTLFIERHLVGASGSSVAHRLGPLTSASVEPPVVAAMLYDWHRNNARRRLLRHVPSGWRNNRVRPQVRLYVDVDRQLEAANDDDGVDDDDSDDGEFVHKLRYRCLGSPPASTQGPALFTVNDVEPIELCSVSTNASGAHHVQCSIGERRMHFTIIDAGDDEGTLYVHSPADGELRTLQRRSRLHSAADCESLAEGAYTAPMPSKILHVHVKDKQSVEAEQLLLTVESMKMELRIHARAPGQCNLFVAEGQLVDAGTLLCEIV